MWPFSRDKPKIKVRTVKKDGYSGWLKCSQCEELVHEKELAQNLNCCPKCDHHYRIDVEERIEQLVDEGSFKEMFTDVCSIDPLHFVDEESYEQRLKRARAKSGRSEGVIVGQALIEGRSVALGVMDFQFMGGSMGSAVGERLTLLIEYALCERLPLIIISASGGARMQESTLSLMQMAKTCAALGKLNEARVPYISILTNPTTGGVTASFAALGDLIFAEPDALIGFTGPRVIEQTIRQKLPEGFQTAEFVLSHGMIDGVVRRRDLRHKIALSLNLLLGEMAAVGAQSGDPVPGKWQNKVYLLAAEAVGDAQHSSS
jgi:acetyl-CoA carboxylase carboxyl transferase subunit beta